MIKNHDTRPLPEWIRRACIRAGVVPHWLWIYVDIGLPHKCWNYVGAVNSEGYGRFRYNGRMVLAHRAIICLSSGMSLEDLDKSKLLVRHKCDNTSCCNPSHLETGTHLENMRDKRERGRCASQKGSSNMRALLTESDVRNIRRHLAEGHRISNLAAMYGVSDSTIDAIKSRQNWKHVV